MEDLCDAILLERTFRMSDHTDRCAFLRDHFPHSYRQWLTRQIKLMDGGP